MKKRALLLLLTLALLITCAVFTVSASGKTNGNTFEENFVCPCNCGKSFDEIEWRYWGDTTLTPTSTYSWTASDHYLVTKSMVPASASTLTGTGDSGAKKLVLVLHAPDSAAVDFGITRSDITDRTFVVPTGTTAYIVGDNATIWGRLISGTTSDANGGLIKVESNATLNVSGTVTMKEYTDTTNSPYRGGLIYNSGTVSMTGATLDATGISMNSWGGAVYNAGSMTLTNCSITGTTASKGGTFVNTKTLNLTGCTVSGGKTTDTGSGGNFFINGGTTTLTSCTVSNGEATYGGNIYIYTGRVNVRDTATAKTVISNGVATTNTAGKVPAGGNFYVYYKAATNTDAALTGYLDVNMVHADSMISGGTATNGGNIYTAYSTTLTAGKITGGSATTGGTIYVNSGSTTIVGATVENGTATTGGVIYHKAGTLNLKGGNITGKAVGKNETATVTNGGAIYISGGTVNMGTDSNYAGPVITGTKLTDSGNGGAVYFNAGTLNLTKGTITGGEAKYGGCIYTNTNVTVGNVIISNGKAYRGGCVYVPKDKTYTMTGGSISGGDSTNQGGQAFVAGTFNMEGGTVTANPADASGAPGFRVQDGKLNLSGTAVVISAGADADDAIDIITAGSTSPTAELTLAGSATVKNKNGGTDGDNLIRMQNYKGNRTKLTVKSGWSGKARTTMNYLIGSDKVDGVQYAVGMVLDTNYAAAEGAFTGELILETAANQPPLIYNASGALQVCPIRLCAYNLPKLDAQWFTSATAAAAAAQEGEYIDIYAPVNMDIGVKDVLVDFNGHDCTVTGTGTLSILDAAGDGFNGTLAKITYANVAASAVNPYNDRQYIALKNDDDTYSAHRIDLRISAVSVRPTSAGVYYTAQLNCDDTLKETFTATGVAVSLDAIPGADFQSRTLYTEITKLDKNEFTGVLINEILKDGVDNDTRGKTTIYANAYATFTVDGQTITVLADPYNAGKTKETGFGLGHTYTAYSLSDVMNAIDLRWRTLNETAKNSVLDNLYNAYGNVMHGWDLQYMIGQVKNLKVLTIGNSLSVDAGHMLGYIAKIEGMENIRFSTLYYGGCTLRQHVNFLTANTTEYRWYDTEVSNLQNATDEQTVPEVSMEKKNQITMYNGIVMDDWDIIVLQQGVFESGKPESYGEDLQTLIDYVRKHATNPNMVLMWNMIWAGPVEEDMIEKCRNNIPPDATGFVDNYKETTGWETSVIDDKDAQNKMFELIRDAVQQEIVGNDNFTAIMPSGTAQQNALWSGMTDADMYRDYIHASDLARYIYSYVWYCTLTDADFDSVESDTVPLAVRYIKKDDISEIPPATEDLDLTETVEGYDYRLLDVVNHSIASALENPFTPKGIND